jgi:hypothetical protein
MSKPILTVEYFEKVASQAYDEQLLKPLTEYCITLRKNEWCGCALGAFVKKEFNINIGLYTGEAKDMIIGKYDIQDECLVALTGGFDNNTQRQMESQEWFECGQRLREKYKPEFGY